MNSENSMEKDQNMETNHSDNTAVLEESVTGTENAVAQEEPVIGAESAVAQEESVTGVESAEAEAADVSEERTEGKEERKAEPAPPKKHKVLKRCLLIVLIAVAAAGIFLAGAYVGVSQILSGSSDIETISSKLDVLQKYVDNWYLYDADQDKIADSVYHGYMEGLEDQYSVYYSKEEYDQMTEEDSGSYRGIGVTVYSDSQTGYVYVETVNKNGPAYKAGIQSGDLITKVEDTETNTITLNEAVKLIRSGDGDSVNLTIYRDGEQMEVTVNREDVAVETVQYEMKDQQIGYISVSEFIEDTDEAFIAAVDDLTSQGMKGLIIDLRDDGGGMLETCVNMVSRIIPKDKQIVYLEDKQGRKDEYNSDSDETVDVPICILVNGNSASASEVFTGCLKDYGTATVIGSTTFGKGIVQSIVGLGDGSAIKITTHQYFTPNGNNIHGKGIEPDVAVEVSDEEWLEAREDVSKDTVLKKAMEILTLE